MLVQNVTKIESSLEKAEFLEYADLYIKIVKKACLVEGISEDEHSATIPICELIKIGVVATANEVAVLENVLCDLFYDYIAAVNTVAKNHILFQYVCQLYNSYRKDKQQTRNPNSPTVVDFFCGAGGLSLGFRQSGFNIVLANDIEDVCIETYKYNHPEIPSCQIVKGDIKELIANINKYIDSDIDVVVGGPPCQGFSQANKNHRVIDDPRNQLYKYYLQAIERIVPKFVIMENVRGMLSVAHQVVEDYQSIRCNKNGKTYSYSVSYQLLNSEYFSVAQSRERLIYIAIRNDVAESLHITPDTIFSRITAQNRDKKVFNLQSALSDIAELDAERQTNHNEIDSNISGAKVMVNEFRHNSNEYLAIINQGRAIPLVYNHKARYCSAVNYEIYKRLNQGDDATDEKIKDIMPYAHRNHCFKDKYYKLIADKPCRTITAHLRMDCHSHIHPFQVRAITPREAARVQSFPDDYVFLGAYLKTYMQIGNAVPVVMARAIAKEILICINEEGIKGEN